MAADVATASSPEGEEPPQTAQAPAATAQPTEGKKAKKAKDAGASPVGDGPSVAAHPRAARGVARAKGWGGLIGFLVGGYMSLPTNTAAAAGLRALVAGVICYVVVWAGAVFVWRRLVMLEIKNREQQLLAAYTGRPRRELTVGVGDRSGASAPT